MKENLEEIKDPQTNIQTLNLKSNDGEIHLGKKLENPYSVVNMQKAYNNIKEKFGSKNSDKIKVSHLYVRFLPKSFDELALIQRDNELELFDYPLDYELEEGGTTYHDPSLPIEQITWQYCAVVKNYKFPDVEYEVIEELYLPESKENKAKETLSEEFLDALITEAMRITGNLDENTSSRKGKWHPSGSIMVWDDVMGSTTTYTKIFDHWEYYDCGEDENEFPMLKMIEPIECKRAVYRYIANTVDGSYVPVAGCKVRAYSWFQIKSAQTDDDGKFEIDDNFRNNVNYSIKWERADFDIRSGNWGQAYYNGPRLDEQKWNLKITKGGMSFVYAHIHRGAYEYYYKHDDYGIKSPPKKGGFLTQRLHLGAMDKEGRAHYYEFNKFFTTPQIKIYRIGTFSNGTEFENNAEQLFGTAVHELAHASHWEIGYSYGQYVVDAIFSQPYLPESWAEGVESVITSTIYQNDHGERQSQTIANTEGGYTPIVIDLMDSFNQGAGNTALPFDRVENYTLQELELALYNTTTWGGWRNNIKSLYANPTWIFIDELFDNY